MNWHLLVAVLAAGTVASFTDWLFMGVLFHDRYNAHPEIWWLGYFSAAALIALCALAGVHGIVSALVLVTLAWAAGPLLVLVVNGFFIKLDPLITVAHSAGYLARFLLAGLAAGIALG
jgi:hypothetical protein